MNQPLQKLLNELYDNSIITMNMYALVLNQESIRSSWMNDFGIPPIYENKSHIESTLCKNHTYLGGVGLIGDAWGLAAAVYAFLFGADMSRPWGVVQSYCCGFPRSTQKKLTTTLPTIPFFNTINPDIKNRPSKHALSLAEQNELILTRIDSLELFLQEYVVDVHYLNVFGIN
ncbi:unnamed protein product [Rhizophagus irregularis]|nr:unnamed protein product [Rhizophagus irregularis]